MIDNCNDCKKLEEKIYWSHFQTVQFSRILSGRYEQKLAIPEKFSKHFGEKLGKEVSIKVPSGAVWNVGLERKGETLYFKLGWKEFVQDNSLEENDILIFKFRGSSEFDVLLFNGDSSCEKEASYFVRKCGHSEMPRECKTKEKDPSKEISERVKRRHQPLPNDVLEQENGSFEDRSESSDAFTEWTPRKRPRKNDAVTPNSFGPHSRPNGNTHEGEKDLTTGTHAQRVEYISNRRPVTDKEKENAHTKAKAVSSDDSLVLVMQPYQVYRGFYLTLPSWWARDHLPERTLNMVLQVKGNSYPVNFSRRGGGGMITTGWKQFALENSLEEFDVCSFTVASERSSPVVLEVGIFRVVEEVVPPTPTCPASSKGRGRGRGWRRNQNPRFKTLKDEQEFLLGQ